MRGVPDLALAQSGAGNRSADWEGGRATLNLGTGVFTWVRPVHNSSASGFRFASALQREGKPEDGCNFYATSIWSSREAYEAGKEALDRGTLVKEFGAPGADPLLFEGKLVLGTPRGV